MYNKYISVHGIYHLRRCVKDVKEIDDLSATARVYKTTLLNTTVDEQRMPVSFASWLQRIQQRLPKAALQPGR